MQRLAIIKPIGRNAAVVFIKELPCFLITMLATLTGIQFLNHNPIIELVLAISLSMLVEYLYTKIRHAKSDVTTPYKFKLKYALTGLAIGLVTWGLHQFLLHGH